MDIIFDEPTQNPKQIGLRGRLDLKGTGEIELRFTSLTATDANDVVIDMSGVDFIASLGMRLLLTCAKAKSARGGRMIMFGLQPMVSEALETAGIDNLIPIFGDAQSALASLQG
jgi:anti-sigma B factor antagonist